MQRPARFANSETAFEVIRWLDVRLDWRHAREVVADALDGARGPPAALSALTLFLQAPSDGGSVAHLRGR